MSFDAYTCNRILKIIGTLLKMIYDLTAQINHSYGYILSYSMFKISYTPAKLNYVLYFNWNLCFGTLRIKENTSNSAAIVHISGYNNQMLNMSMRRIFRDGPQITHFEIGATVYYTSKRLLLQPSKVSWIWLLHFQPKK